ncbi:MAG TPA: hypothetical protein PK453_06720 [Leptospiraceae bacterium]|nr:hypothetical protein [Leptospiraceae bacterium]HMY65815.1 hypothetical protein [Leptospiraceae bacterium]HNF13344.1 hypothetical protein [Leptospiraceae bacterium]HNF22836.1 hypothetical protein [Leptospiraceae bacterium]HNH08567.1 hypothetical protein [Leptospiraceae bacterium]
MKKFLVISMILACTAAFAKDTKKDDKKKDDKKEMGESKMAGKTVSLELKVKFPPKNNEGKSWDTFGGANQKITIKDGNVLGGSCDKFGKSPDRGLTEMWKCKNVKLDNEGQFPLEIQEKDAVSNDYVGNGRLTATKKGEQKIGSASVWVEIK